MSAADAILSQLPIDEIAAELGVTPAQVEAAAAKALPALLGGMAANAEDEAGARSLGGALDEHGPLVGPVELARIDLGDGEKIVGNVFGPETDAVVERLAGTQELAGLDSRMTRKLLAILAPLVLSYVAGKVVDRRGATDEGIGATILQEILKGALRGTGGPDTASTAGGILGDLLGGLLGRGRR